MEEKTIPPEEHVVEKVANVVTDTHTNVNNPLKRVLLNNFLGGIAYALGISFGATLVIAVLGFVLAKVNLIPIIGMLVIDVNRFIAENGNSFHR